MAAQGGPPCPNCPEAGNYSPHPGSLSGRARRGGNHGAEQRHLAGRPCARGRMRRRPAPRDGHGTPGQGAVRACWPPPAAPDGVTALAFHLKMTGRLFVYPAGSRARPPHSRGVRPGRQGAAPLFRRRPQIRLRAGRQPGRTGGLAVLAKAGARAAGGGRGDFCRVVRRTFGRRQGSVARIKPSSRASATSTRTKACFGRASGLPRRAAVCARTSWPRCAAPWWEVLEESIAACGSSIRDYRTARGDAGSFQNAFPADGRGGEACVNCGRTLRAGQNRGAHHGGSPPLSARPQDLVRACAGDGS